MLPTVTKKEKEKKNVIPLFYELSLWTEFSLRAFKFQVTPAEIERFY